MQVAYEDKFLFCQMKLNDITRIFTKELIEATEQQNLKSDDNEEDFAKNFEQKSLI